MTLDVWLGSRILGDKICLEGASLGGLVFWISRSLVPNIQIQEYPKKLL